LGFAVFLGSLTLLSDAFHNLSDVASLYIAYWALKASKRGIGDDMTYGWARTELIGGLINGCALLSLCIYIVLEAIPRYISAVAAIDGHTIGECEQTINKTWSIYFMSVAGGGLLVNTFGTIMFALTGHGHSHAGGGHNHSHGGDDHGHSHGKKKKEKHGHSHGDKEKKHGHSHGDKEKKKAPETQSLLRTPIEDDDEFLTSSQDQEMATVTRYSGLSVDEESNHGHSHGDKKEKHGHSHGEKKEKHGHSHGEKKEKHGHSHGEKDHGHSHGEKKEKHGHSHGETDHGHSHGDKKKEKHGHSHGEEKEKGMDMNMRAVFLHYVGDMLSSAFVLITGLLFYFLDDNPKFVNASLILNFLDPTSSLLIVGLILWTTVPLVKSCAQILLQSTPEDVDVGKLRKKLSKIDGVRGVHDLHVWQLVDGLAIASVHILCDHSAAFDAIQKKLQKVFHKNSIHSSTIQPEFVDPAAPNRNFCEVNCVADCEEDWCCKTEAEKALPPLPISHF